MQSENMQSNEGNQKNPEAWMEVCELASREQNPEKLMELTNQLIRLLDEKKTRPANPSVWRNLEAATFFIIQDRPENAR